uniref:phage tail fiber protein n=1 Tax=Providencia sp. PROV254 TaxID=2949942 RepID=UPI0023494DA4
MYSTGTVTTIANSTKLVGTGTKWLNNINRVSAEQAIQIQINNTVYNNSIQSIQSDTELTLNFPLPTAATGAKYVILTTMVHSASDAMNKIVAMQVANVQFSDILTRWMTEQDIITVTLPDQTTQQLRTTKEMDKQLDGKFDKSGGQFNIDGEGIALRNKSDARGLTLGFRDKGNILRGYLGFPSESNRLSLVNSKTGKLLSLLEDGRLTYDGNEIMKVGDYGWGGNGQYKGDGTDAAFLAIINELKSQIFRTNKGNTYQYAYSPTLIMSTGDAWASLCINFSSGNVVVGSGLVGDPRAKNILYGTANTTKDSNGNLKAASPIVKLFSDDVELNEESEGVEMEHLGIGHY